MHCLKVGFGVQPSEQSEAADQREHRAVGGESRGGIQPQKPKYRKPSFPRQVTNPSKQYITPEDHFVFRGYICTPEYGSPVPRNGLTAAFRALRSNGTNVVL
jgi:hypothetical protein